VPGGQEGGGNRAAERATGGRCVKLLPWACKWAGRRRCLWQCCELGLHGLEGGVCLGVCFVSVGCLLMLVYLNTKGRKGYYGWRERDGTAVSLND
jgi:hypothetical protein